MIEFKNDDGWHYFIPFHAIDYGFKDSSGNCWIKTRDGQLIRYPFDVTSLQRDLRVEDKSND